MRAEPLLLARSQAGEKLQRTFRSIQDRTTRLKLLSSPQQRLTDGLPIGTAAQGIQMFAFA